jgi:aminoglycoside phosphotransferase (APT) family kinase protein
LSTAELQATVEDALAQRGKYGGPRRRIVTVGRQPGRYSSSFSIEDVDVTFDDGTVLSLVLKDLSPTARLHDAARIKPAFLYDPLREIETYRLILEPCQVGAPRLYAAVTDPESGRYLLLLERVRGRPLWQVGEFEAWLDAARWLARLHAKLATDVAALAGPARLLGYDAAFYRLWIDRAREFLGRDCDRLPPDTLATIDRLADGYDRVIERLVSQPPTVIHGEFHASNVLVEDDPPGSRATTPDPKPDRAGRFRIRPVDWEMAAAGPALMDLADLIAGKWTAEQKGALAGAYSAAAAAAGAPVPRDLSASLDACRLHRAVQWLGWSADWTPPREHAHDWLDEVLRLTARLLA